MPRKNRIVSLLSAVAVVGMMSAAAAQSYPTRDITFVVPFAPGGSTDIIARQFVSQLEEALGNNINVENRPGGSGTIGASILMEAEPDGYTIGIVPSEVLTYQPLIHEGLPYQTPDDYQPIAKLGERPSVLLVRADAPWADLEEFIEDARARPGEIRASVPGVGTLSDLVVQEFNRVADIEIVTVPFTGGGPEAMVALLGGRVEVNMGSIAGSIGQIEAGALRALAVFQAGVNEVVPDATSVIDAGYNTTLQVAFHVIAPNGLPPEILDRLAMESQQIAESDRFAEFAAVNDLAIDVMGPDEAREDLFRLQQTFRDLIADTQ
jgi:tripartite-type tricarboxylate transporter receptor subunit TctC